MEMNKICDLENCDPNDLSRPSVSPTDRRLFLAGALALPLAAILANVDLAEAQAAKGVSIKQTTADGRTVSAYFAEADKKDAPVVILALWINPSIQRWLALLKKPCPSWQKRFDDNALVYGRSCRCQSDWRPL